MNTVFYQEKAYIKRERNVIVKYESVCLTGKHKHEHGAGFLLTVNKIAAKILVVIFHPVSKSAPIQTFGYKRAGVLQNTEYIPTHFCFHEILKPAAKEIILVYSNVFWLILHIIYNKLSGISL